MGETLQNFVEQVNGTGHLRVEHDFGGGYVRLQTSEAERRQAAQDIRSSEDIVLEMLRNSRDAHAAHIFVAMSREQDKRVITMVDDGDGIPESMHGLVFEPRVTSKLDTSHMDAWGMHGRGMALFSISTNAEKAYVACSEQGRGCAIRVETDTRKLGEKKDQSSFPTFELGEGSQVNVRGPRNILRTICEFAIECRSECSVYVGSPAEIASTLYLYGTSTLSAIDRLFCRDVSAIAIPKRIALAPDPSALEESAQRLGLSISERTARRIMDGEVADAEPVLDRISISNSVGRKVQAPKGAKVTDARSFRLQKDDAQALAEDVKRSFAEIAERYYLEGDVEPTIKARRDRVTITIPVVRQP